MFDEVSSLFTHRPAIPARSKNMSDVLLASSSRPRLIAHLLPCTRGIRPQRPWRSSCGTLWKWRRSSKVSTIERVGSLKVNLVGYQLIVDSDDHITIPGLRFDPSSGWVRSPYEQLCFFHTGKDHEDFPISRLKPNCRSGTTSVHNISVAENRWFFDRLHLTSQIWNDHNTYLLKHFKLYVGVLSQQQQPKTSRQIHVFLSLW